MQTQETKTQTPLIGLGIDPGTTESGWVLMNLITKEVIASGVMENKKLCMMIAKTKYSILAIEYPQGMGMAVGKSTFETCTWIGWFECVAAFFARTKSIRYLRTKIKTSICGQANAKDPNVRQALMDRYPATGGGKKPVIGTKSNPGPLFGVASHAWQALAVLHHHCDLKGL